MRHKRGERQVLTMHDCVLLAAAAVFFFYASDVGEGI